MKLPLVITFLLPSRGGLIGPLRWTVVQAAALVVAMLSRPGLGQVDNLTAVLDTRPMIGTKTLGGYGYDPTRDAMFLIAYGSDFSVPGNPGVVKVTDVSSTPAHEVMLSQSQLQLYYTDGNPNLASPPAPGGLLLNPRAIGSTPAYARAIITDGELTRLSSGTALPAMSRRLYSYNLQAVPVGLDGRDVFTTRVTLADMQAAANKTTTSSAVQRQFAWSGDGQSVYYVDSSPGYGGLWQVGAVSGTVRQILPTSMEDTEPGVNSTGGIDRIYFSGISGTTGIGNAGGIDFVTHDGVTTSGPQVALGVQTLLDFFEVPGTMSSQRIRSVAFDGSDMYFGFFNTNGDSKKSFQGIYRRDAEGRISKVVNRTERAAMFAGVNQTLDHFQPREITYTGTAGSFPVTQILYRENGANTVAGATAFKPVDFNRDNAVTSADLALFTPQVTIRGQVQADVANLKFDMNGNDTVDWKDVQIVESFLDYEPDPDLAGRIVPPLPIQADADLNGVVDFADFQTMQSNYGGLSLGFTLGDFNGDNQVSFPDLQPWINSYGFRSAVVGSGVPMAAFDQAAWNTFLAGLTPPTVTLDVAAGRQTQFEVGYRSVVIAATVTKTGSGTLIFDGVNTFTGTTVVASGTAELANASALASSPVAVAAGATLAVAPYLQTSIAGLDLSGNGLVDLTSGFMTVTSGLSATELVAEILVGRGDGSWTGASGVTSSTAAADVALGAARAVGWLDNGDGSLSFAYAAPGDSNLDWQVDVLDAANVLASGKFNTGDPATWAEGDFNYDGVVDVLDAADFITTGLYNQGLYNPPADSVAAGGPVAAVPEPASAGLLAAACGLLLMRRSMRRIEAVASGRFWRPMARSHCSPSPLRTTG
jgi:autotransporter-associated beta strand protein